MSETDADDEWDDLPDDEWDDLPDDEWDDPNPRPRLVELDPAPLVVGSVVGVAGLLLFLQPTVRSLSLFGRDVPMFVLSVGVLSLGLGLGAVHYFQRGDRLVWTAHAIGAAGFGLLFVASGVGSLLFVWLGLALVLGGVLFLTAESWELE